jgi:DNA-binding helix-hairpin-helix protein with protein kinase domain
MKYISVGTNREIVLSDEIAKGAEGKIYKTDDDRYVAKIFLKPITQEKIDKLQVMLNNKPENFTSQENHIFIAWIHDLLKDSNDKIIGFLMPNIKEGLRLNYVYHPQLRHKQFAWNYLHLTAINVALIVKSLHAQNYIIGDIKPENLMISNQAQVSIVDTDSFQIQDPSTGKIYRSPVSTMEFTPVESMGKSLNDVDRSEAHDNFALAVIIYLLLFGEHPFSDGEWLDKGDPPSIDERVLKGYWLHAHNAPLKLTTRSMPLEIVHPKIQACFRKCFDDGHMNPHARPSAEEWYEVLMEAYNDLTNCEVNHAHQYANSYGKCYWCLRLEQLGVDVFSGSSVQNQVTLEDRDKNGKQIGPRPKPNFRWIGLLVFGIIISIQMNIPQKIWNFCFPPEPKTSPKISTPARTDSFISPSLRSSNSKLEIWD